MKRLFSTKILYSAILAILLVTSAVILCVPSFSVNDTNVSEKDMSAAADKEQLAVIDEDDSDDGINSLYMSEGYKVIGGDLYCDHVWNDWILTRVSTIRKGGSELRYCSFCRAHQTREFGETHGSGRRVLITGVPSLLQMPAYPNGCEVVSLTMVLRYMCYSVTTDELIDNHLARGYYGNNIDDPFYLYLGNPRSLGVGCYAPCIVNTANSYLNSIGEYGGAVDISGMGFDVYKEYIDNNVPVIFWGTTYMDCDPEIFGTVYLEDKEVIWRNHSHCFVMIGYTDSTYIFCDPLRGIIEYPIEDVENSHSLVYSQACVIQ